MISPQEFYNSLAQAGVTFAAGVPDSLLKEFCSYLDAALPAGHHMIASNEGTAVALATGVHLGTGGISLVYLQNSGLGNAINPLLSLADAEVYGIPMVLLIGWRSEPGIPDEPQHCKQGRISPAMLAAMEIPFEILTGDPDEAPRIASWAVDLARKNGSPVAILVKKGAFSKSEISRPAAEDRQDLMSRESAIALITGALPTSTSIVSTTGMASRELYEHRVRVGQGHASDFLTVGSMGHSSQIALGIALSRPHQPVACFDGDGALLMHMGGLTVIGTSGAKNYLHILLNNGVHDSVGGQPTVGLAVDLVSIARASGYKAVCGPHASAAKITAAIKQLLETDGPRFLEVRVKPGARNDLGRPKEVPAENKRLFVDKLRRS